MMRITARIYTIAPKSVLRLSTKREGNKNSLWVANR